MKFLKIKSIYHRMMMTNEKKKEKPNKKEAKITKKQKNICTSMGNDKQQT